MGLHITHGMEIDILFFLFSSPWHILLFAIVILHSSLLLVCLWNNSRQYSDLPKNTREVKVKQSEHDHFLTSIALCWCLAPCWAQPTDLNVLWFRSTLYLIVDSLIPHVIYFEFWYPYGKKKRFVKRGNCIHHQSVQGTRLQQRM